MKPVTILLAAAALAASLATAQAQGPRQRADGLWVCPNDETRVIVNGDWRVLCYTNVAPSISMEEFKKLREQYDSFQAAQRDRLRKFNKCDDKRVPGTPRSPTCDD